MARSGTVRGMLPWLGLALLLFLVDQFTKVLILGHYALGDSTYVTSFFNIVRVHNPGAAFSFLASASGWQRWFFTALGIGAAVFIVWLLRSHSSQRLFAFSMACLLGGAVGNVVDRVLYGYVHDPGRIATGAARTLSGCAAPRALRAARWCSPWSCALPDRDGPAPPARADNAGRCGSSPRH